MGLVFIFHQELLFFFTRGWITSQPHQQQPAQQCGKQVCPVAVFSSSQSRRKRWLCLHQSLFDSNKPKLSIFPHYSHITRQQQAHMKAAVGVVPAQCEKCRIWPLRNWTLLVQRWMDYRALVPSLSLSPCVRPMDLHSTGALVFSCFMCLLMERSPPPELGTDKRPMPFWTTIYKTSEGPLHNILLFLLIGNKAVCHLIFYEVMHRCS